MIGRQLYSNYTDGVSMSTKGQWWAHSFILMVSACRQKANDGPTALYRWCQYVNRRPVMGRQLYTDGVSMSTEGQWWADSFIPMMSACRMKADDIGRQLYTDDVSIAVGPLLALYRHANIIGIKMLAIGRWWVDSFIPMMLACRYKANSGLTAKQLSYRWC